MDINTKFKGAYVFSSGKNMGVFKAVGYPEDVGRFYRLDEYEGYSWTAHGRYPTNTPGWWGGAHPFALLDYSVVHNGEISSYDANRRFIEMFGYKCTLQTDTEVITYIADYLLRRQGTVAGGSGRRHRRAVLEHHPQAKPRLRHERLTYLRTVFPSLLITGPFSIVLGFNGGLMALNDRLKLRSMVTAEKGRSCVHCKRGGRHPRDGAGRATTSGRRCGGEPVIVTRKGGEILMAIEYIYPAV